MKNKTFALGAIAGISSVALAVPVLAQISSAQDTGTSTGTTSTTSAIAATTKVGAKTWMKRGPDTTVAGIQTRIDHDSAFLTNIDAMIAIQKSATQTHKAALTAALSITDDTQRAAAVKAADEAERSSIETAVQANASLKDLMPFGGMGRPGFGGGHGGMMKRGPGGADLAAKLGMTEAGLKTALEGGKTIEQIATEKGVTLPARPDFKGHKAQDAQTSSVTSAQ